MKNTYNKDQLLTAIADLDEDTALDLVRERLTQNYDPYRLIKICQAGLQEVGKRYEQGSYYLSGLIMGGEILKSTVDLVKPLLKSTTTKKHMGNFVLGTVEGDIHDIGTSIVNALLSCEGFNVIDLGVNVPPEKIVQGIIEYKPKILGLSCLLTTAFESLKRAVDAVESAGLRQGMPIIIGGGQLDSTVCDYVNADYWTNEVSDGVAWIIRTARTITTAS